VQIQPQDFNSTMRRQQIWDILNWCIENIEIEGKEGCGSLQDNILSYVPQDTMEESWLLQRSSSLDDREPFLDLRPWDLAQYLAVHDYIYISRMLARSSLDILSVSIARDDATILLNPELRAEQIQYWVTIRIVSSPSMSLQVRSISMFIETVLVCQIQSSLI
jgi:hypothetical protein